MVALKLYFTFTSLIFLLLRGAVKRKFLVKGKVVGIRRGSVYDVETVKPNTGITMTLFGAKLWPGGFESIWLTDADRCEDSFRMKKAVYYMSVVDELSYENVLVLERKEGIPENEHNLYRLCAQPALSDRPAASDVRFSDFRTTDFLNNKNQRFVICEPARIRLVAARRPFAMVLPFYTMIVLIVFMVIMSALFSGLNLSFTSVAINELNVIIRMGDVYQSRLAKNVIPVRRHLNWLICTFATANAITNCALSLLFEAFLESVSDGRMPFAALTAVPCMVTVIFGELLPLAICNRRGLYIASKTRYLTWSTMIILSPVAWPLSKILDAVLGYQACEVYDRSKIEFLILEAARTSSAVFSEILKNAINLPRIRISNVMTKIDEAFLLSTMDSLDNKLILSIVEKGYTRIPVYEGSKRSKVIAVLNVKDLIATDFSKDIVVIDILKQLNYLKQDEQFQWTNRRIGLHRDQATFDWLRSEPDPLAPLEQIYRIQETLENYPGFKELSFNVHSMRRLFHLCQTCKSSSNAKKFCIYRRGCASRSATVMLRGDAFYLGKKGIHVPATPIEFGAELIQRIYLRFVEKGTSTNLSNVYFIPPKSVYVESPFLFIKITVRSVVEAMKITKVEEYRREVSEAKHAKLDETVSTQYSNSISDRQRSALRKEEHKTDSTQSISGASAGEGPERGSITRPQYSQTSPPVDSLPRSVTQPVSAPSESETATTQSATPDPESPS